MRQLITPLICLLALASLASGCAGLTEAIRNGACGEEAGYEKGMNDAREGKPMNSQFTSICNERAEETRKSYRAGYNDGMMAPPAIGAGPAYTCTLRTATGQFTERGASRDEATRRAVDRCEDRYPRGYCMSTGVICSP